MLSTSVTTFVIVMTFIMAKSVAANFIECGEKKSVKYLIYGFIDMGLVIWGITILAKGY